jgi:hypothetical protein
LPWEANLGFAYQFGRRPFNPRFDYAGERDEQDLGALELRRLKRDRIREQRLDSLGDSRKDVRTLDDAQDAAEARQEAWEQHAFDVRQRAHREELKRRDAELSRRYFLVSAALLVTGNVTDAVGVDSFLQRVVNRSGKKVVFSPRLGIETETVANWMKVRAGVYGEPTRFESADPRVHGTLGMDIRLFSWDLWGMLDSDSKWRMGASMDAALRYLTWGVGIGLWH